MASVLIAGCGDVGTALGLRLGKEGHTVFGLRRHPEGLPAPIKGIRADLCKPETFDALPAAIDHVVYIAAADEFADAAYQRAYVTGVKFLLGILSGRPIQRFLFVSSTSVYAQREGEWVDEESATEPESFSGRRLLEGEGLVLASPLCGVVVRFAGIYGPGRIRLIDNVLAGQPCRGAYTNRIHRDDCVGVLHHLIMVQNPASIYIGVDDEPVLGCTVTAWLAQMLGVESPVKSDAVQASSRGHKRCRNRRLRGSGYCFEFPTFREGYTAVLGDMKSREC